MTAELNDDVHAAARILWDFHTASALPHGEPGRHDLILALGSHDLRVAEHAALLWRQEAAPLLICSGDRGRRTGGQDGHTRWERPEAAVFADIAHAAGVPRSALLLEDRSTNTGENLTLSRALCEREHIAHGRILLTAKPYMARRALAAAQAKWPGPEWAFSGPALDYDTYPADAAEAGELVHFLVGDLQRLRVYAERGWSAPVDVPSQARAAFDALVTRGFTAHLVPGAPTGV
ncbi:YdcF family protein [Nocardiopsis sediminis]|uniref:YdcF family protein n=1 Tax=Nocardiopsis sediminis TaxID=1778267 RepID=A0ABV8FZ22_9ACTN